MEERIYKRQVTKESTAKRITEEAQIQRHFLSNDLDKLYKFEPDIYVETESQAPRLAPPKVGLNHSWATSLLSLP